jgi:hypothetical protein
MIISTTEEYVSQGGKRGKKETFLFRSGTELKKKGQSVEKYKTKEKS